jgi:hypothetical protein
MDKRLNALKKRERLRPAHRRKLGGMRPARRKRKLIGVDAPDVLLEMVELPMNGLEL